MHIDVLNIILFTQNNSGPRKSSVVSTVPFFQISDSMIMFWGTLNRRLAEQKVTCSCNFMKGCLLNYLLGISQCGLIRFLRSPAQKEPIWLCLTQHFPMKHGEVFFHWTFTNTPMNSSFKSVARYVATMITVVVKSVLRWVDIAVPQAQALIYKAASTIIGNVWPPCYNCNTHRDTQTHTPRVFSKVSTTSLVKISLRKVL